jgi:hypothetical protein
LRGHDLVAASVERFVVDGHLLAHLVAELEAALPNREVTIPRARPPAAVTSLGVIPEEVVHPGLLGG